jgi:hypothetical protein
MAILKGEVEWACVQAPNTAYEDCWTVDVLVDAKQAKEFIKASKKINSKGASAKKESDGRYRIKVVRAVLRADGKGENKEPAVRDSSNKPTNVLIGNGSICNVQYRFYEWKNRYGIGVSSDLKGIQILDLVEYGEPDGDEFDNESGEEDEFENEEESSSTKKASTESNKVDDDDFDDDDFDDE